MKYRHQPMSSFDTLKFVRTLRASGIPGEHAEAFSDALSEVELELDVATRADLEKVHGKLSADLEKVHGKLSASIEKVRGEMRVGIIIVLFLLAPQGVTHWIELLKKLF